MKIASLLFALFFAQTVLSGPHWDTRKEELSRINNYELVTLSIDFESDVNPTLSFKGFGNDYKLSLKLNENLLASNIKHTNGIPSDTIGFYTSLTKSCHYTIAHSSSSESSDAIHGSISLCPKRGVRGKIVGFGETLIIKPAKYYLDLEFDSADKSVYFHNTSDTHLIYRMSDYNMEGIPFAEGIAPSNLDITSKDMQRKHDIQVKGTKINGKDAKIPHFSDSNVDSKDIAARAPQPPAKKDGTRGDAHGSGGSQRKLMAYNYGNNQVELCLFVDPSEYYYYFSTYGSSSWYDELVSALSDYINDVSDTYESTDWGSDIGDISVHWVELEVATSFSGTYASLYPDFTFGTCNFYSTDCEVDGSGYLNKLNTWIGYYKDTTTFDNLQLISHMNFYQAGGWGYVGEVCKGTRSCANTAAIYGYDWTVRTITHELGHNFNCQHDQDTSCGINAGLMGYGTGEGFSSCSIYSVQTYFYQQSGLSCLGDGVRSFSSNMGDVSSPTPKPTTPSPTVYNAPPTPNPTPNPTPSPTPSTNSGSCYDYECVEISGLSSAGSDGYSYDFNTVWSYEGCSNNYPYYMASIEGSTWFLYYYYYSSSWGYWAISTDLGSGGCWAYCANSDVNDCGAGEWTVYTSTEWSSDYSGDAEGSSSCTNNDDGGGVFTDDSDDSGGDSSCSGYSCIYIQNMDLADGYYDFNGKWVPSGCYNGETYYWYNGFLLYYSSYYTNWHINDELSEYNARAFCYEDNVVYCSSNFYVGISGNWQWDGDSVISYCSGLVELAGMNVPGSDGSTSSDDTSGGGSTSGATYDLDWEFTHNCSNNVYGDSLCLYNDGRLWSKGIAEFVFSACKDDYPYYYYHYIEGNYSLTYYLHYNALNGWYISERTLMDTTGIAYCEDETDIKDCTYEHWYVQNTSVIDAVFYDLDETMGYDANCAEIVTDDSDSVYCSTSGACALWQMEVEVVDSSQSSVLCDDSFVMCVEEGLYSTFSTVYSDYTCGSDYQVDVSLNVSFTSVLGYTIYSAYFEDFESVIDACEDGSTLTVDIMGSTLHVCDACDGFVPSTETDSEGDGEIKSSGVSYGTVGRGAVGLLVVVVVVAVVGAFWQ